MTWHQWVHGTAPTTQPPFRVGDEIRVWYRILEQEGKERLGQFQGIVIRLRGSGSTRSFTVRRVTHGEGVERAFPLDAKTTAKVELIRQGKVKRARLYYLRDVIGKARIAAADQATQEGNPSAAAGDATTESRSERAEPAVSGPAATTPSR